MITKEEMNKIMKQMEEFLKSMGLNDDEIADVINISKIESVINGTYKGTSEKHSK